LISKINDKYKKNDRGIYIVELEDAVQLCTKPELYDYLIKIAKAPRKLSLSDTLLETLSIIAYKQPVTRMEIEKIRGVSCEHAINRLVEFKLVQELGRMDAPGRPLLFGTTEEFLRTFGVKSLGDLPIADTDQIEDFKKQAEEEVAAEEDIKVDI
jgi:segregation and condensation protein B